MIQRFIYHGVNTYSDIVSHISNDPFNYTDHLVIMQEE